MRIGISSVTRRETERTLQPTPFGTGTVAAGGGEVVVLNFTGRGVMHGFMVAFGNVLTLNAYIKVTVDGTDVLDTMYAGIVNALCWTTPYPTGTPSIPVTLTNFDGTNDEYGFSWTAPIYFNQSIVVTLKNTHASITMDYSFTHSTEIWA